MAARAILASRDVAAERSCPAALDRAHHLQLVEADVPAVGLAPSGTVVAEDIRDLQSWAAHAGGALCGLGAWLGTLALLPQPAVLGAELFERTIDGRDPTRGDTGIPRGGVQLRMPERPRVIMHLLLTH